MTRMIVALLLNALIVLLVARVSPGVRIKNYGTAIVVALVYGLLTWGLKWLFVLVSFPLVVITFGLFLLVINALLLWMTDKLVDGLEIKDGKGLAFATIGITLGSVVVNWLVFNGA